MQVGFEQTPPTIRIAVAEEAELFDRAGVRSRIRAAASPCSSCSEPINERSDEAAIVEQVARLRRGEDEIGMPAVQVVGCEELADQDRRVEHGQHGAGDHGEAMAAKLPPHHPPLRGEIEPFLLGRQPLDRVGIEWRRRYVVVDCAGSSFAPGARNECADRGRRGRCPTAEPQ